MSINLQKTIQDITIFQLQVLIFLLINTCSAQLFRFFYLFFNSKNLIKECQHIKQSTITKTNYFLIAGFFQQPNTILKLLNIPEQAESVFFMRYSVFGYSLDAYRQALRRKIKEESALLTNAEKMFQNIGISITIGDQVLLDAPKIDSSIAINPCSHGFCFKERYRILLLIISPLLEITKFFLGWLAFIPFIKINRNWFSLRLIFDQLSYAAHVSSKTKTYDGTDRKVILDKNNTFLDNNRIKRYFLNSRIIEVTENNKETNEKISNRYNYSSKILKNTRF